MLLRIVLYGVVAYLVLVAALFLLQYRLLYLPDRSAPSRALIQELGLEFWPDAASYRGLIDARAPASAGGTVIVFHGNAGAALHRTDYIRALAPLGYRVLLAEYPGYGGRDGSPDQRTLVRDAAAIVQLVYEQFGEPVYLWGESLGSGVAAAAVAKTRPPVAGLVLIAPWDSLPALAQTHYPYLPARALVRDRYNNIDNLAGYRGPVAVILAARDRIVPARHGRRLYDSLADPKKLWLFEDASHNHWPAAASWSPGVMQFLEGRSRGNGAVAGADGK